MRRQSILLLMMTIIIMVMPVQVGDVVFSPVVRIQVDTDPISLINGVNTLRAANGLPGFSINSILMDLAQRHAHYMSVAGVTHYGQDGSSPWQRGLAAGYPLAGDLSRGGYFSENITAGKSLSVQDAVASWQGDAPHLSTMLSPNLTEIGAGVVVVGDYVYYVIDCARPITSGQPQVYTPVPGDFPPVGISEDTPLIVSTLIPVTALADGKVYHIVKPGETLWLIAISYGVKIAELRQWNDLTETQGIFPGNKLFIKQENTPRRVTPTLTATFFPIPVATLAVVTYPSPTTTASQIPMAAIPVNSNLLALGIIVAAALVLAVIFVRAGRKI